MGQTAPSLLSIGFKEAGTLAGDYRNRKPHHRACHLREWVQCVLSYSRTPKRLFAPYLTAWLQPAGQKLPWHSFSILEVLMMETRGLGKDVQDLGEQISRP